MASFAFIFVLFFFLVVSVCRCVVANRVRSFFFLMCISLLQLKGVNGMNERRAQQWTKKNPTNLWKRESFRMYWVRFCFCFYISFIWQNTIETTKTCSQKHTQNSKYQTPNGLMFCKEEKVYIASIASFAKKNVRFSFAFLLDHDFLLWGDKIYTWREDVVHMSTGQWTRLAKSANMICVEQS